MKRTDTQIHHIELLLTLDYLLNYTDEKHPATQQDICRHAINYGLTYNPKATKGNDVRRQRIKECLAYLQYISYKFEKTDKIPFVINTTDSGKYYLVEKNHLNEEQIIKILGAITNDKYTKDEDTSLLINKLLDSLTNRYNREHYLEELNKLNQGVNKYNLSTNRKIRLVSKAFKESKMLKIRHEIISINQKDILIYDFWYRVYKIKEFKNKPYAILLPIDTGEIFFNQGIIFDSIENLNIPKGLDKEVLAEDLIDNRDLNELFAKSSKKDYESYQDIDNLLNANIMLEGGEAHQVSFYFRLELLKFVKKSFENHFSTPFEYVKCSSFNTLQGDQEIIPNELNEDEKPIYGVVNMSINLNAFKSWLLSDPHDDGYVNIGDMITVVSPSVIKNRVAYYYAHHLLKYKDDLSKELKDKLLNELK